MSSKRSQAIGFLGDRAKDEKRKHDGWHTYAINPAKNEEMAFTGLLNKVILENTSHLVRYTRFATKTKATHAEVIAFLEKKGGRLVMMNYNEKKKLYRVYAWEDGIAHITVNVTNDEVLKDEWGDELCDDEGNGRLVATAEIYGTSTFDKEIFEWFDENFVVASKKSRVYTIYETQRGSLSYMSSGLLNEALETLNYEPEILKAYDTIVEEYRASDPRGKLTILYGEPGTGKTYFIRALITDLGKEGVMILVPPQLVPKLGDPKFIPVLKEISDEHNKPIYLLIEDADTILSERNTDNINHISAALNLGDGILGQMFDIRLICTANVKLNDLDPAITRPGRLLELVHIDKISPSTAAGIVKKHGFDNITFDTDVTLATVYEAIKSERRKANN